jgi:hypothetical protein
MKTKMEEMNRTFNIIIRAKVITLSIMISNLRTFMILLNGFAETNNYYHQWKY